MGSPGKGCVVCVSPRRGCYRREVPSGRRRLALTSGPGHWGAGDHIHACPRRLLLELQRGGGVEKREEKGEGRKGEAGR